MVTFMQGKNENGRNALLASIFDEQLCGLFREKYSSKAQLFQIIVYL